jgi:RHS repeat-associated protein
MKRENIKHHLFMHNYRKRLILFTGIVCLLFASLQSYASQDPTCTNSLRGWVDSFAVNASVTTNDNVFSNPSSAIEHTYKIQNVISFGINERSTNVIKSDFDVTVSFSVARTDTLGNVFTDTQHLRVCYKIADTAKNKVLSYFSFTGAVNVVVKIISITPATNVNWDYTKLLYLKNDITAIRDYVFTCNNPMPHPNIIPSTVPNPDELNVWWTDPNSGETEYDLEWAWVDESAIANYTDGSGNFIQSKLFNNNASRVTIAENKYAIPLLYDDTGRLFIRVRPAQTKLTGQRIEGDWSLTTATAGQDMYNFTGHEPTLNWQASTSYAEEGKRKSVIQYFDGSLRSRQTVTKDNSTATDTSSGTTIVAETFYDYQGRAVIQVLPAPTLNTIIAYSRNFNQDLNFAGYPKSDYDLLGSDGSICSDHAAPLSDTSGSSQYYSRNNPLKTVAYNKYIPDAKDYPFTETRFAPDATGRVASQGGVGINHQIGSGHETKYTYEVPAQSELNAMFGTDAGFNSHYTKNWVKDANAQYSVSYVDMHGRTVATALAGKAPDNLDTLPSYNTKIITKALLDPTTNIVDGRSIVSTSSIVLATNTNVAFNYNLTPDQLRLLNCNKQQICYDCLYNLVITITPDCNSNIVAGSPHIDSNFTLGQYQTDTTCRGNSPLFKDSFTLFLNEGTYTVTKELQLSSDAQQYFRDSVFVPSNTCKSLQNYVNSQTSLLTAQANCNLTCSACTAALGGGFSGYVKKIMAKSATDTTLMDTTNMTAQLQASYQEAQANCDRICSQVDDGMGQIRNLRQIMLEDMSPPGGQYARIVNNYPNLPFNIFNGFGNDNVGIARNRPPVEKIRFPYDLVHQEPYYLNPVLMNTGLSQADSLTDAGYTTKALYQSNDGSTFNIPLTETPMNFKDTFQTEWANQLLPYHPEYMKLVLSETVLRPSYNYEGAINDVNTWSVAADAQHDYIQNIFAHDPFFQGPQKDKYAKDMLAYMNSLSSSRIQISKNGYENISLNMWQVSLAAVFCRDSSTASVSAVDNNSPQLICAINQPKQPLNNAPGINGGNCSDWDYAWKIFKTTYLGKRKLEIEKYLDDQTAGYIDNNFISGIKEDDTTYAYTLRFAPIQSNATINDPTYNNVIADSKSSNGGDVAKATADANNGTAVNYSVQCQSYVPTWYNRIISCPTIATSITSADSAWFMQQLLAICVEGSDLQHPFGSSSISSSDPAIQDTSSVFGGNGISYRSFMDVLNRYLTVKQIPVSAYCNPYQIDDPGPYDQPVETNSPIITKPSDCECDQIHSMKLRYTASHYAGTFSQFLLTQYGTKISQDTLDILDEMCGGTYGCNFLATAISLPPVLECPGKRSITRPCLNCNDLKNYRKQFYDIFKQQAPIANPVTANDVALNDAFTKFMNATTGFTKTAYDYVTFMNACSLSGVDTTSGSGSGTIGGTNSNNYGGTGVSSDSLVRLQNYFNSIYPAVEKVYYGNQIDTTSQYTDPAYYYWDKKGKGHPDASGCDTTFWRINQSDWNQDQSFRMADYLSNGILKVPDSDTLIDVAPSYNLVKSFCVNGGFTITMRVRDSINTAYAAQCPYAGEDGIYGLINFETMFSGNYFTVRSSQTDSSQSLGMHNDGGSITSLTDTVHDRSISANYDQWRIVQLQAKNGQFTFSVDGTVKYQAPLSSVPITKLNFSSVEAVGHDLQLDWWKVTDNDGTTVLYDEQFNDCGNDPTVSVDCPVPPADSVFKEYFNQQLRINYTYTTIDSVYNSISGGGSSTFMINNGPTLCGLNLPAIPDSRPLSEINTDNTICSNLDTTILATAEDLFVIYLDSIRNVFDTAYYNKCMSAKNLEHFTATYNTSEYHYTLYYYDQAGNLIMTVPPAGVDYIDRQSFSDSVDLMRKNVQYGADPTINKLVPNHLLTTNYRYNTLNQVIAQSTPDAGVSDFWYDRLGRLAISQNAKQANTPSGDGGNQYSYTLYDDLGRITEVGQKPEATPMSQVISQDTTALENWVNTGGTKTQITRTVYDVADDALAISTDYSKGMYQANLRNRVSYTYVKNVDDPSYLWDAATFYSYDIHGNVDTLLQDYNTGMGGVTCSENSSNPSGNRFKKLVYQYDLISGKVNQVAYQPGQADQFYHRYSYDAENRLTSVQTSKDSIYWENEAGYQYYKHGPLARTVLGQQQVQGIDYAYTLQGWLKGVNNITTLSATGTCATGTAPDDLTLSDSNTNVTSTVIEARRIIYLADGFTTNPADDLLLTIDSTVAICDNSGSPSNYPLGDMGSDGIPDSINANVARDAYSFNLNYYNGDYKPVSSDVIAAPAAPLPNTKTGADLFNGNINSMAVNIPKLGDARLYAYRYDQLNRLVAMQSFTGLNTTANVWTPVSTDDYKETITYDPNGNILTYNRNGAAADKGLTMDKLSYTYNYYNADGTLGGTYVPGQPVPVPSDKKLSNQLNAVNDAVGGSYTDDIKNQSANNYTYDKIGNLTSDVQGRIQNITWTVYGKIQTITKTDGSVINYAYDASGNRISKTVQSTTGGIASTVSTYYVRDATGNVMSIYESGTPAVNNNHLTQSEIDLYGSSRLGVYNVSTDVQNCNVSIDSITNFIRGNKFFELTNHLGNVLATVSDRKMGVDSNNDGVVDYYTANVVTANDYYPFGMQINDRLFSLNNSQFRYGFNGQEKSSEIGPNTNTALFWEYDSRIGRRWNRDPKSDYSISSYACFSNNPIGFSDPFGDTLRGSSSTSASRIKNEIQKTFSGDNKAKLRSLFKISADGKTMSSINKRDFESAIVGLTKDEKALAYGYFNSINGKSVQIVEMSKRTETLSPLAQKLSGNKTGAEVDDADGGGVNMSIPNASGKIGSTFSIIVMDSKNGPSDFIDASGNSSKRISSPGELLAHETLGHGLGSLVGSSTFGYEDAIQMSNLYLRVQGAGVYRNGANHGRPAGALSLLENKANEIPSYIQLPYEMQVMVNLQEESRRPLASDKTYVSPSIILHKN